MGKCVCRYKKDDTLYAHELTLYQHLGGTFICGTNAKTQNFQPIFRIMNLPPLSESYVSVCFYSFLDLWCKKAGRLLFGCFHFAVSDLKGFCVSLTAE